MALCKLCQTATTDREPFCLTCGHPRISDSLLAPRKEPPWLDKAWLGGFLVLLLAFVLTVGVAFLREAKALRWGRAALEHSEFRTAYQLVAPFAHSHPGHVEGLFLAGRASIGLGRTDEARRFHRSLAAMETDEEAVEKNEALQAIYRRWLAEKAATLPCGQSGFAGFFDDYRSLGKPFRDSLLRNAAILTRKCVTSRNPQVANEPGYWLIHEQDLDRKEVLDALYVNPAREALKARDLRVAKALALQALAFEPELKPEIEPAFTSIRTQFASMVEDIQEVCDTVAGDTQWVRSRTRCFPEEAPAEFATFRDPWNGQLTYQPRDPGWNGCRQGFNLVTWAPESRHPTETEIDEGQWPDPTVLVAYSTNWRTCRKSSVDPFWQPRDPD